MRAKSSNHGLIIPSLIWLAALVAAVIAAYLRGLTLGQIWPMALIAASPALIGLLLSPVLRSEWAQLLVIFAWLALAIIGCITIGFVPMGLLFLCAPVAAALFEKEKVVEALVMATIIAIVIYFAERIGRIPDASLSEGQIRWGQQAGLMATLGLIISTLLGAAHSPLGARAASLSSGHDADDLLHAVSGSVMRFDGGDNMISANEAAKEMFSLKKSRKPISLKTLLAHEPGTQTSIETLIAAARQVGKPQQMKLETRFEADTLTYLDLQASPVGDQIVLHAKDVTYHEKNLEKLRRTQNTSTQKADDKSLFFAGVSHELRTPLNAIIGFSDMMRSRLFGPLPSKYAEYAELIHDSGQHMLDLIGDVLDMSKVEAGQYELHYDMFDASDVIRSTVKMIRPTADAAKVRLDVDIDDDNPLLINADRKAVRQILLNLMSNAIKFSDKGSAVVIGAKSVSDTLNLTVSDHGSGMSKDEIAQLGTPYKQMSSAQMVEERGTGLGITLVKSLTELHGGRFAVASQKGEGTTVDVFLPLDHTLDHT